MATDPSAPEDFASLLAEFDRKSPDRTHRRELAIGDAVRGTVVSVGRDEVFVAIEGGKAEAMLDTVGLRDADGKLALAVGDVVDAHVVEIEGKAGCVVLRQALGHGKIARGELEQAFRAGLPVEGHVTAVNKGGVEVDVAGVRAFCPVSQLDLRHVEDPATFVGQKLTFRITRYEDDKRGANVVLSRRALLEEAGQARAAELAGKLRPGAILPGVVTGLKDFGAFVDLGGIEGMVHVSQIGHARVERAGDALAIGQRVQVQVLEVTKRNDPKRPLQIALSIKSLANDPWDDAAGRFEEGATTRGTVTRVETFGAFVEVAPGIEGLLHASELAPGKQVRSARDLVKSGQVLDVVVLAMDRERKRLSLGLATGDDGADPDDMAALRRGTGAGGLGTLGDLFKKRPPK